MEGRGNGGGKDRKRLVHIESLEAFLTSKVKCNPFGDSFLHAVISQDIHTHM